jgi:hypothetical protein
MGCPNNFASGRKIVLVFLALKTVFLAKRDAWEAK